MRYLLLIVIFPLIGFSQSEITDSLSIEKSNPIIFGEYLSGVGKGNSAGIYVGGSLNYQHQKHLFTLRYILFEGFENSKVKDRDLSYLFIFPAYPNVEKINDYSVLYGNRYINGGLSYSWSAGLGIVNHQQKHYIEELDKYSGWENQTNIGVPIELSIKWFKSEKKRFRAPCGLIPITRNKVAFGRSIGFKFIGNISKNSYFGLGISYGFGTHKDYSTVGENP
jgi:hypothetical protein